MVGFQLKAATLLAILVTTQCSAGDDSPASISKPAPATQSAYFTEMMVQSDSLEPAKCSDRVLEARRTATITQGVEPTVSLQAALLIFLGVGIFAVFIAQAFQMVSSEIIKLARMLMQDELRYSFPSPPSPPQRFGSPRLHCFTPRCENMSTGTRTTWTQHSTQGARCPSG